MGSSGALVVVGRVSGVYGVRGWIRVFSFTEPREAILVYSPWWLQRGGEWAALATAEGRRHGRGVIARLKGCEDRDAARDTIGADIAVRRDQLPALPKGEFYWADLVGLEVVNLEGVRLGTVDHLIATGAHDVLVLRGARERLVPFAWKHVVHSVDRDAGRIVVDWHPDD